MLSRHRLSVGVMCLVAFWALTQDDAAWGQRPPFPGGPREGPKGLAVKPASVEASGTIQDIGRAGITISSITGEPWLLRFSREASVHVTGTAKKDVLAGREFSFISFAAEVDKQQARVQGQVERLTVFTPSRERSLGAFPEGTLADAAAPSPFGDGPLQGSAKKSRGSSRQPRAAPEARPVVERFQIAGRIAKRNRNGTLSVYVPNPYFRPNLEVELAEEPQIELDLTGPAYLVLVRPGDQVQARGSQVGPNMAQVTEVTITLAEPFTTIQPKKPPRRTPRSSRTKPAETEEAVEAEEEPQGKEPDQRGARPSASAEEVPKAVEPEAEKEAPKKTPQEKPGP
jgi:hypothetical protein